MEKEIKIGIIGQSRRVDVKTLLDNLPVAKSDIRPSNPKIKFEEPYFPSEKKHPFSKFIR